eukprot:11163703-Lingulodinium_polyedra.AAC.1
MFRNVSSDTDGSSLSATDATGPWGVDVSRLAVAIGGGVTRSFFNGPVGGVEHGAAALSLNRMPR